MVGVVSTVKKNPNKNSFSNISVSVSHRRERIWFWKAKVQLARFCFSRDGLRKKKTPYCNSPWFCLVAQNATCREKRQDLRLLLQPPALIGQVSEGCGGEEGRARQTICAMIWAVGFKTNQTWKRGTNPVKYRRLSSYVIPCLPGSSGTNLRGLSCKHHLKKTK